MSPCPTLSSSCSSAGGLELCLQLHSEKWEILCSNEPAFHASKYTYCSCPEAFGKSHGLLQKEKNVLVRQNCIHFFFLLIAMSFWNVTAPSFCQHPPRNSYCKHFPSLCGSLSSENVLPLRNWREKYFCSLFGIWVSNCPLTATTN